MIRQTKLIILIIVLILILTVILFFRLRGQNQTSPSSTPKPSPSASFKTLPLNSKEGLEQIDPEIYTTKKWINSLPIATEKYYLDVKIEYAATDSAILAIINSEKDKVENIKDEVLVKLKEIGVDLNKEKIIWQIK